MRYIFLVLFFISFSNSATLLTQNIYERSDRVDLMLSFDSPFDGKITKKIGVNTTILQISNLSYDKLIEKNIQSNILQNIIIKPNKENLTILLRSDHSIMVMASKTIDGFGLRIRTKPVLVNPNTTITKEKTPLSTKPNESLVDGRYLSVIFLLSIMIIFMFWIKKRVAKKNITIKNKKSWLFKTDDNIQSNGDINILQKKQLDNTNSVVLLEFEDKKYLIMTGSSNVLLEKFSKDDIRNDSDFQRAFEDNKRKFDEYLKIETEETPINDYRSKLEKH